MTDLDNEVYVKLTVNKRHYRICQIVAMVCDFDTFDEYVSDLITREAEMYIDTSATLDGDFQINYGDRSNAKEQEEDENDTGLPSLTP